MGSAHPRGGLPPGLRAMPPLAMSSDPSPNLLCNPFSADIFPEGDPAAADAGLSLHLEAQERLEEWIAEAAAEDPASVRHPGSRIILLKAPRAGYGKSHLLSQLPPQASSPAIFIPVEIDPDEAISWKWLFDQVLPALHGADAAHSPTPLDLIARRTFAAMNAGLIQSGKIPCENPTEAVASLESHAAELFDFAKTDQPVAQWFQKHFERLLPFGAPFVAQQMGISEGAATFWLRALCGYAQGGAEENPNRLKTLGWAIRQPEADPTTPAAGGMRFLQATSPSDPFYKEKLKELCRLAAATQPLVIILDHLDGLHGSSDKALRLTHFLNEWRGLAGRMRFILSVNQDLWHQTFLKSLPSALEDRLTGSQVTLGGISREAAGELVRLRLAAARVPEAAALEFTEALALPQFFAAEAGKLVSPRVVLRYAAAAWYDHWKSPAPPAGDPAVPIPKMREMLDQLRERFTPPAPTTPSMLATPNTPASPPAHPAAAPPPLTNGYSNGSASSGAAHGGPGQSGAILPDPVPATPRSGPIASPFLTSRAVGPDHALQVRFHTLRAHFSSSPWLLLDQDRLYHLMKISGQRLAVVRFLETGLPGQPGAIAGVWQSPDAEILFGSEPYEDRDYWAALIDFARQRSAYVPGSRLVMFSAAAAPVNLGVWLHQDEIVSARAHFLDLQTLDHPALAACYAADEVVRESERGTLALGSADAFAALAPQLEPLWKKLTRPLAPS